MQSHHRHTAIRLAVGFQALLAAAAAPSALAAQEQLRTTRVGTLSGEVVELNLPADIRPGDQISGTVVVPEEAGRRPSATLQGAVVEVQGRRSAVRDRVFAFAVPAGAAAFALLLKDGSGRAIGETSVPVSPSLVPPGQPSRGAISRASLTPPATPRPGNFAPMYYGQPGRPATVTGNFDGDVANTRVSVGGRPTQLIAESPRALFYEVPQDAPSGRTTLAVEERGVREEFPLQVTSVALTAAKTTLLRGENEDVHVVVSGLENLELGRDSFRVELTNLSPQTVRFRDAPGTVLTRQIAPADVRAGSYSFDAGITGLSPGGYTLQATLASGTCRECWKAYEDCTAAADAEEQQCYKDCDRTNGGTTCYLACSAAARLQETECFTAYTGCMRRKLLGL
ncbi:MAG TPA: hypothetical protein VF092_06545 [Longimicrobium sp.]